jgi:hypothetical protein
MAVLNLRRGFNRIFALLFVGWAFFCLFAYPISMAREINAHYDRDFKSCYRTYGVQGLADYGSLQICLSRADGDRRTGTYSGFGSAWDEGESWSLGGYYRHMGWVLPAMILIPPLAAYGLVWAVIGLSLWVWRGFCSTANNAQKPGSGGFGSTP